MGWIALIILGWIAIEVLLRAGICWGMGWLIKPEPPVRPKEPTPWEKLQDAPSGYGSARRPIHLEGIEIVPMQHVQRRNRG